MTSVAELRERKAKGLHYVQVVVNRKKSPRRQKVRVMPGVYGICVGQLDNLPNTWLVDVAIDDMLRALGERR
jgi:hypothetical protein